MARMAQPLLVVTLVCVLTQLSFADRPWGPASLNDPSAGVIGVNPVDIPAAIKVKNLSKDQKGVLFGEVIDGGFIHLAGGRQFDMILALNGWKVESNLELYVASKTLKPGEMATAIILRGKDADGTLEFDRKPVQISALVPTRGGAILSRLVEVEDQFVGRRIVRHLKASKDRTVESQVTPYFLIANGKPTNLRVVFSVVEPMLSVPNSIEIRAGEKVVTLPVKIADIGTNIGPNASAAWVDWPVTDDIMTSLSAIGVMGKGTVRFKSHDGTTIKIDLGRDAATRITEVLVGYKLRGGDVPDENLQWFCDQVKASDEQLVKVTRGVMLKEFSEILSPAAALKP